MQLRIARNPIAASITFALSEIEKVGKNNGNRPTTEDEAIKVIQKIISTIDENLKNISGQGDVGRKVHFEFEKKILSGALPKMVSDQEIIDFLRVFITGQSKMSSVPKKGEIMKALRDQFGALVDMKRAGEIASEIYGV